MRATRSPRSRAAAAERGVRPAALPRVLPPALLLAATLLGCNAPPDSAYVSVPSGTSMVSLGQGAGGEECRMARTGRGADIWCGEAATPSARVRPAEAGSPMAAAESARAALESTLDCAAPRATTVLGGEPAALVDCRRRNGGWPAFAMAANAGGRVWQADGILPALPAAERAIGVLSGRTTAESAPLPSAAIDQMAARLAREAFTTGDVSRFDGLMAIGRDANQAERFVAAETAYRAALAVQERALGADAPANFQPMVLLALQLSNQGRFPEAEALFRRAATLAPRAPDPLAPAMLAHYQGLHEANRNRPDDALRSLASAAAAYRTELPPDLANARAAGGPASGGAGPLGRQNLSYDPLVARAMLGLVEARRNSAAVLRSAGRGAEAEAAAAEADRLAGASPGMLRADLISARLARTGASATASTGGAAAAEQRYAQSAAGFSRGVPRSRPYAETILLRAGQQGRDGASLDLCRDAAAVLRALREGTTADRIAPCVDGFVAAAARDPANAQALLAEAFEAAQLAQGAVTTTQIAAAAARLSAGARDPAVGEALRRRDEAERDLAARYRERDAAVAGGARPVDLAAIDARIAAATGQAGDADAAVQTAAPGFAQLVQSVAPAAEVLGALAPGEAMVLATMPEDRRGWSFLLLDGRIHVARVGTDTAAVAALVQRVRAGVESGDATKPFDAEAAHDLHRAVFAGVAEPFNRATALVAAPEGPLLQLPWGVMVSAPPPAARSHEGAEFLLARLPVAHVPGAASLVTLRRAGASTASRPWFGFGAPVPVPVNYAARSFPAAPDCGRGLASLAALPAAQLELGAAAQVMGAGAGDRRLGSEFTQRGVMAAPLRDVRVLHFATHGILPADLACLTEPTIVASAPTGPDAGQALLGSSAVLNLELNADLAVLSACNTGGGAAAGESLSTLARAFFFAGARGLMVTHWYVNDVAAARVVAFTLQNIRNGQDPPRALRAAQLDLTRVPGASHPALWAPFAILGPGPGTARAAAANPPAAAVRG